MKMKLAVQKLILPCLLVHYFRKKNAVLICICSFSPLKILAFLCCFFFFSTVFAQTMPVGQIKIDGNKRTKEKIILRELPFSIGDSVLHQSIDELIGQATENLRNTALFNFVEVSYQEKDGKLLIFIRLEEQWYLIPIPSIYPAEGNLNTWWQTKQWAMLTYALQLTDYNFRGHRDLFSFKIGLGFDNYLWINYSIPYVDKKQTFGLSFEGGFNFSRKTTDKVRDYELSIFKSQKEVLKKGFHLSTKFVLRPKFYLSQDFALSYHYDAFSTTVFDHNPDFWTDPTVQYFKLYLKFKYDKRDYNSYPLKGYYIDVIAEKLGFGLPFETVNAGSLQTNIDYFQPVVPKIYFGAGFSALTTFNTKYPLYVSKFVGSTGTEIRGLYPFLIPIDHLVALKTNFKFELLHPTFIRIRNWDTRVGHLSFAFYFNVFLDAMYLIENKTNMELLNQRTLSDFQSAIGMGLDMVTSYDKVLRLEAAYNFDRGRFFYGLSFKSAI